MPTAHASPLYAQWRSGAIGSSRSERCIPTIEQGVRLCRCYSSAVSVPCRAAARAAAGLGAQTRRMPTQMPSEPVPQPCAARAGLTTHRTASCAPQRVAGTNKPNRVGRRGGWVWWFGWEHRWLGLGIRVCEVLSERRQAAVSIRAHWPKRVAHAPTRCRGTESLQTVLSSRPIHALATAALARGPANAAAAAKSARAAVQEARASRSAFHKTKVVDMRQCTAIT